MGSARVILAVAAIAGCATAQTHGGPCVPYSAEQDTQLIKTLADGTHITSPPIKVMHYRDSEGRERTEETISDYPGAGGASAPPIVHIVDPVAGYNYYFNLSAHTANRAPLRPRAVKGCAAKDTVSILPSAPGDAAQASVPEQYRSRTSQESLGKKTIEGVSAEGVRTTVIWPVGAIGNDRPITVVTEVWSSPELGIEVLRTNSDPRVGESTIRLTKISRAEPDAALFKPPADYRIEGPER